MERVPFREVVLAWRDQEFGGRVPLDREERVLGFLNLFETLLAAGYEAFEIFMPSNKGHIVGLCHNANHRDKEKGKTWERLVEEDLMVAKGRHPAWPRVETKKFDAEKSNYKPGTQPVHVPRPAYEQQATAETSDTQDVSNEELAPTTKKVTHREFTKEEWDKVPPIKVEYDPEMRKILGYDDE